MIILQRGNILDALEDDRIDIIAHGVNCAGGFGSGLAGQIAKKYPKVKQEYLKKYNEGQEIYQPYGWMLGDIQPVEVQVPYECRYDNQGKSTDIKYTTKYIINCATQREYGSDGTEYVNYDAIRDCMYAVKEFWESKLGGGIAIPKIGSGLGGGDWEQIEDIILTVFEHENISVYVL